VAASWLLVLLGAPLALFVWAALHLPLALEQGALIAAAAMAGAAALLAVPTALALRALPPAWRWAVLGLALVPALLGVPLGWDIWAALPFELPDAALALPLLQALLPVATLPVLAAVGAAPPGERRAAADLGAGGWARFVALDLPRLWPGLLGGFALALVMAAAELALRLR